MVYRYLCVSESKRERERESGIQNIRRTGLQHGKVSMAMRSGYEWGGRGGDGDGDEGWAAEVMMAW